MTLLEAIDIRASIRDYYNEPISPEDVKKICKLIDKYNDEAGLSISWLDNGNAAFDGFFKSYGMFKGIRSLIVLKSIKSIPDFAEKLGYYGEILVLEAVSLGLGTCWVGGSYDKKNPVLNLKPEEQIAAVILVGHPTEAAKQKPPKKKKKVKKLYAADSETPDWFAAGMDAVSKAPSAVNRQPVKFYYIGDVTWAKTKSKNMLASVDRGIAKAHFDIGAQGSFEFGQLGIFTKQQKEQNNETF